MKVDTLRLGERIRGALSPWPTIGAAKPPPLLVRDKILLNEPVVTGEKITERLVELSPGMSKAKLETRLEDGSKTAKGPPGIVTVAFSTVAPILLTATTE